MTVPADSNAPAPFAAFQRQVHRQSSTRAAVTARYRSDEAQCVRELLDLARLAEAPARRAHASALSLARGLRRRRAGREGFVQDLLAEFSLSSQEGVALMCLAEALLRIPDDATRDALIRDRIGHGDWRAHTGSKASIFVHAATWGLVVTGRLVSLHDESGLSNARDRAQRRAARAAGGGSRDAPARRAVRGR